MTRQTVTMDPTVTSADGTSAQRQFTADMAPALLSFLRIP